MIAVVFCPTLLCVPGVYLVIGTKGVSEEGEGERNE